MMEMHAAQAHVDWGKVSGLVFKDLSVITKLGQNQIACVNALKANDPNAWGAAAADSVNQVTILWNDYKALGLTPSAVHAELFEAAVSNAVKEKGTHDAHKLFDGTLIKALGGFLNSPTGQTATTWLLGLLGKVLTGALGAAV